MKDLVSDSRRGVLWQSLCRRGRACAYGEVSYSPGRRLRKAVEERTKHDAMKTNSVANSVGRFTRTSIFTRGWLGCVAIAFAVTSVSLPGGTETFTTSTRISETNTAYGGQDIVLDGNITVTIDGPHAFNSLLLTNGAVLTHSPCTAAEMHKLDVVLSNEVVVSNDSRIDVSAKG